MEINDIFSGTKQYFLFLSKVFLTQLEVFKIIFKGIKMLAGDKEGMALYFEELE